MKTRILLAVALLCATNASAEISFQSLDNKGGTNISLIDNKAPAKVEVTEAVLYNNGKELKAKSIRCDLKNGTAIYKLKFKRLTTFKDCRLTLTINGTRQTLDIQRQLLER